MITIKNKNTTEKANNLIKKLNENPDSPYIYLIKFPDAEGRKGCMRLPSIIKSIKVLVVKDGEFDKYGLNSLDEQYFVLRNYFTAIKKMYGTSWFQSTNPFIYSSGFNAAIDILITKLLARCSREDNYSVDMFSSLLKMDSLIQRQEIKGQSEKMAREKIKGRLAAWITDIPKPNRLFHR